MTEELHLKSLSQADREIAHNLSAAFDTIVFQRVSPARPDQQAAGDAEVADDIAVAFSGLTFTRPSPSVTPAASSTRSGSRASRRTRYVWLAGLAAASVVTLTTISFVIPDQGSVAWAETPTRPSSGEVRSVVETCSADIAPGLGELEYSGLASPEGSMPAEQDISAADSLVPRELPPLTVLDLRGEGALALFADDNWNVVCLLSQKDGTWVSQGLTVTSAASPDASSDSPPLQFGSSLAWASGETLSYLAGGLPATAARATLMLPDGTVAEASILGDHYAVWFPGTLRAEGPQVRFLDATGAEVSAE